MWSLVLVSSYMRLHHSWIIRSFALVGEITAPKIYLAFKGGFYFNGK
jgi:hypothetical protein